MILLIMGVTGSGKSTIGKLVAERLAWVFLEADEFHSPENITKMHNGIPLTDADRLPWLDAIHARLVALHAEEKNVVLACSALKESYRQRLAKNLPMELAYLKGSPVFIGRRLSERHGHFAGTPILAGQFADLEEPREALTLSVELPPDELVRRILHHFSLTPKTSVDVPTLLTKLRWRLLPFLFLLYVVAYLDRINVGFAALQMKAQLGFSDSVYGLGAGIFFLGYFLFQVPANLALERVGARRWISALMICWGIISGSMFSVHSVPSFYSLRFLLGAAEAGFFPGVIFYLRSWFPASARAGVVALFMTAGPVSGMIGGPISGLLLDWNHRGGLAGWQWMFLLEAIPAILLGFAAWFFLADKPGRAPWLSPAERSWLLQTLDGEAIPALATSTERPGLWFVKARLWGFALVYFGLNTCTYGISLWLPTALHSLTGLSNFLLGLLSTVPYLAAAILMVVIGAHSDRTGERRWHIAFSAFAGGIALVVSGFSPGIAISVFCFAIALSASSSMAGPFWAMASGSFAAAAAARSIALVNAIGNLGSGFGPYWIGHLRDTTGSFRAGLLSVAALLILAGLIVLFLDRGPRHSN
ncbi:MAG TPA: MFS transporter [Candidatus Sulfotelmatobacter sp.]|jgi:ACS family tartrate transporter-like MFS transporter|nr:MFS transporter [Candidatus Sulfotelmatobacter sp.]